MIGTAPSPRVRWSGPWVCIEIRGAKAVTHDPVPPRAAALPGCVAPELVRAVKVRWRIGSANPRKQTFTGQDAPAQAQAFARQIAAAVLTGAPADERGRPAVPTASSGSEPASAHLADLGVPARTPEVARTVAAAAIAAAALNPSPHGTTIEEHCEDLRRQYMPRWRQGGSDEWWDIQLDRPPRFGHLE